MNLSNALALLMAVFGFFAALAGFQLLVVSLLLAGFLGCFIWRILSRRGNGRRGNAVDFDVDAGLNSNLACRRGSILPPPCSIPAVIEDHVVPAGVSLYIRRFLSILQLVARNFFGYIAQQFLMTPHATMDRQGRVHIDVVQANLYHQRQLRIEAEIYEPEMPPPPFTDSDEDSVDSDEYET